MRPRLETLTLLYHIQCHHHPMPATCPEIAATSGLFRMSLLARLRKFTAAGWMVSAQRTEYLPSRGEYKVTEFRISTQGLELLRDNEHRAHEYRILEPKPKKGDESLQRSGITSAFAGKSSIFNIGVEN
jgi:hypothetical protein